MDHIVQPSTKNLLFQKYFRNKLQGELQNSVWNIVQLFKHVILFIPISYWAYMLNKSLKKETGYYGKCDFNTNCFSNLGDFVFINI